MSVYLKLPVAVGVTLFCPDGRVTLPLHEFPSAPPPEAVHDVAPTVCQLTVKGVPVTTLAGAEIEAVIACWTVTVRGVALTAGGPVLLSPSQTKVNCDAPTLPPVYVLVPSDSPPTRLTSKTPCGCVPTAPCPR